MISFRFWLFSMALLSFACVYVILMTVNGKSVTLFGRKSGLPKRRDIVLERMILAYSIAFAIVFSLVLALTFYSPSSFPFDLETL